MIKLVLPPPPLVVSSIDARKNVSREEYRSIVPDSSFLLSTDGQLVSGLLKLSGPSFLEYVRESYAETSDSRSSGEREENVVKRLAQSDASFLNFLANFAAGMSVVRYLELLGESSGASELSNFLKSLLVGVPSSQESIKKTQSILSKLDLVYLTFSRAARSSPIGLSDIGFLSVVVTEMGGKIVKNGSAFSVVSMVHKAEKIKTFGPIGLTSLSLLSVPLGLSLLERKTLLVIWPYLPMAWYYFWLAAYHRMNWSASGSLHSFGSNKIVRPVVQTSFRNWFRRDFFPQQPGIEKHLRNNDVSLSDPKTRTQFLVPWVHSMWRVPWADSKVSGSLATHLFSVLNISKTLGLIDRSISSESFLSWVTSGKPLSSPDPRLRVSPDQEILALEASSSSLDTLAFFKTVTF